MANGSSVLEIVEAGGLGGGEVRGGWTGVRAGELKGVDGEG